MPCACRCPVGKPEGTAPLRIFHPDSFANGDFCIAACWIYGCPVSKKSHVHKLTGYVVVDWGGKVIGGPAAVRLNCNHPISVAILMIRYPCYSMSQTGYFVKYGIHFSSFLKKCWTVGILRKFCHYFKNKPRHLLSGLEELMFIFANIICERFLCIKCNEGLERIFDLWYTMIVRMMFAWHIVSLVVP